MKPCPECKNPLKDENTLCTLCQMRLGKRYAGFFQRFFALIIDHLILFLVTFLIILIFRGVLSSTAQAVMVAPWVQWLVFLPFFYHAFFESSVLQATPGKLLMRIYVADTQGARLSFWRALARQLGKMLSGLIFNLGYFFALFTKNKQALHDLVAQSVVLKHLD